MINPSALFEVAPRYVIDTNVIVAFLRGTDEEYYDKNTMKDQWDLFERLMSSGEIIAPRRVEIELRGWENEIAEMKQWIKTHHHMFRDQTDEQLAIAKIVVNDFTDYGSSQNYVGDLEVISLAGTLKVPVVTLEKVRTNPSKHLPKIPEVCGNYGFECLSVTAFLRREMQSPATSQ